MPAAAKMPVVERARLGGNDQRVTFVIHLSQKIPIKVFTLTSPYRVVIDMPEVKFRFPRGQGKRGKGLVNAYRYGLFATGKSRIVIDVKKPVLVEKAQVLAATKNKPVRLVINLVKTTKKIFALSLQKSDLATREEAQTTAQKKPEEQSPAKEKVAKASAPASTSPSDRASPPKSSDISKPMIVIDPGHGGVDPGAIGTKGTLEKKVVLSFSKALRKHLLASGRYRVSLTRDVDNYIPLHNRVKIGRSKNAKLFISIHADSVSRRRRNRHSVRGASIYILSKKGSDKEARALAEVENRSDIIAGIKLPESANPVTDILIELAQRETNNLSSMFAKLHLKSMKGNVRIHGNKVRSAAFRVLKAPDIPSVLLELGYLSSRYDEANLKSSKWQNTMAKTIVKSIDSFFALRLARNPY